jgi:hypothetical protein
MSFLENLENSMFEDEAGNGFIIQEELPFDPDNKLKAEDIEKYSERLKYMEEYGI